ncbi:hypothetical protein RZS08_37395, partial [Arthrospira platensis SPKY1]|nr:hypothetical protein [Arthrospira platensis SPKY1]
MKPLKVAHWVVSVDLQSIYDYHSIHSPRKAESILEEYDRIIGIIELNPLIFHRRKENWRIYP